MHALWTMAFYAWQPLRRECKKVTMDLIQNSPLPCLAYRQQIKIDELQRAKGELRKQLDFMLCGELETKRIYEGSVFTLWMGW